MKRTEIIKKKYQFKFILKKGLCYKGEFINVFITKNNKNFNRLGIAVSKKAGNSVKRNRIKRLIRENYRLIENNLKIGKNIIILWKKQKDCEEFDFYTIKEDLNDIFIKAKII